MESRDLGNEPITPDVPEVIPDLTEVDASGEHRGAHHFDGIVRNLSGVFDQVSDSDREVDHAPFVVDDVVGQSSYDHGVAADVPVEVPSSPPTETASADHEAPSATADEHTTTTGT